MSFSSGFSLVETMLAVGVAATAIIVLLGFIPSSLDQMAGAAKTTAEARIVQAVIASYQMRPWKDIIQQQTDQIAGDYVFDAQGWEVKADAPERFFTARTIVHDMERLPGAPAVNDRLRQVTVLITDRADAQEGFKNPAQHRKLTAVIAQTDKGK